MSVCIYSPSEKIWGGGQIYIEGLCRFLNSQGIDAFIATSEPGSFSVPTMQIASVASKVRRLKFAPSLASNLKSQGVHVVVLNDLSSLWLAPIFRLFGLKVVSLLHLYLQRRNETGHGHGWLTYHILRATSRFAHLVYSVNKENQKSLPANVQWVGNFIPSWFFDASSGQNKKYDLGLISRLSSEKNIPFFVQVVAKLNAVSEQPVTALIVGKGQEEDLIRAEIFALGMCNLIEVRPWVDRSDLPGVYDQIRCFAITSHHEGFATTLLEAHARGVPAICTRSAGFCGEFLEISPKTGVVFEHSDIQSPEFIRQILNLIEESPSFYERCRRKASSFSEQQVLGKMQLGIEALLRHRQYRGDK